jgi:hypothetical protein
LADADIESIQAESRRFIRPEPTPDMESVQAVWDNTPDLKARGSVDMRRLIDASFVTDALKELK